MFILGRLHEGLSFKLGTLFYSIMKHLEKELQAVEALYLTRPRKIYDVNNVGKDVYEFTSDDEDYSDLNGSLDSSYLGPSEEYSSYIEKSAEDEQEEQSFIHMFGLLAEECCTMQCNFRIPESIVRDARNTFMELSKDEQDIVLLAHLESYKKHELLTIEYVKQQVKKVQTKNQIVDRKTRLTTQFMFHGINICKKFYFFIYNIRSSNKYDALQIHYKENGLAPRIHKLTGRQAARTLRNPTDEVKQYVVNFIENYAEKNAIPLPGRMPNFRDYRVMKLPSSDTKSSVHRLYQQSIQDKKYNVSNRVFRLIWNKHVPFITTMRPADDLCNQCRQNSLSITRTANLGTEEKADEIQRALDRLNQAKVQRNCYQKWCEVKGTCMFIFLRLSLLGSAVVYYNALENS